MAAKPAAPLLTPAAPLSASLSAPAAPAATAATPAPAPPTTGALVIGGQAVQVLSPDEANELDLAANAPSTTSTAPANDPALSRRRRAFVQFCRDKSAADSDAAPAVEHRATCNRRTRDRARSGRRGQAQERGRQCVLVHADHGGARRRSRGRLAAWFLIGSASPRIKLSEWDEANSQES